MEESSILVDIVTIKQLKIDILHNTKSQCMKEVYHAHNWLSSVTTKRNHIQLIHQDNHSSAICTKCSPYLINKSAIYQQSQGHIFFVWIRVFWPFQLFWRLPIVRLVYIVTFRGLPPSCIRMFNSNTHFFYRKSLLLLRLKIS